MSSIQFCRIPEGGTVILSPMTFEYNIRGNRYSVHQHEKDFKVPAFEIGKYPITNEQYARFVGVGGYNQKQWWSYEGWELRTSQVWQTPDIWHNGDNHPVIGVSWYEAIAFCNWMSAMTNSFIVLPTEQQWQRAAQAMPDGSDSGYAYVWGNEWNSTKCNIATRLTGTTEVNKYEKVGNVSPCGVVDLIGNVREWCASEAKHTYEKRFTLKGGTYFSSDATREENDFSISGKGFSLPEHRGLFTGFRVARMTS